MKAFTFGLLILALSITTLRAQQPAASSPAAAAQLFSSSVDVTALIAKAKSEIKPGQPMVGLPILQLAPYRANLGTASPWVPRPFTKKTRKCFMSSTAVAPL